MSITPNFERQSRLFRRQFTHVRAHRAAERCEVVTTFETRYQSSLTTAVCPLFHSSRHVYKILIREKQLAEGIPEMRIKTG